MNSYPTKKTHRRTHIMLIKRIRRIVFDRRAVNNTISATIMAGAVVALGLAVFTWAQSRTSTYNREFGETVDAETARLKEKIVFECIFYDKSSGNLTVFLLNCGTIDGVKIKTVYIHDSSNNLKGIFSNPPPPLYSFETWEVVGEALDRGDEARLVLSLPGLSGFCNIKIVTERGATFDQGFVA